MPPSPPTEKAAASKPATIARIIVGDRPLYCPSDRREGKMNDWVPVLIVALVVVCVTAYLLLDPKLRPPRKGR